MKAKVKFLGTGYVAQWVDEDETYPVVGEFWEGDEHILRIAGGGRVNYCREHGCSHLGGGDWELVE
jgi:hypothetical protein